MSRLLSALPVGLLAIVVGRCTPSPSHAASVAAPSSLMIPITADPQGALPAPESLKEYCIQGSPLPKSAANPGSSVYSLAPVPITPVSWGPRVAQRPHRGGFRYAGEFARILIEQYGAELRSCYHWARYQQRELAGVLTVVVVTGPWGEAERVQVTAEAPQAAALAACVQEALADLRTETASCEHTTTTLQLAYAPAGLPLYQHAPQRPQFIHRPPARPPEQCMTCPIVLPQVSLRADAPVLKIPDFLREDDLKDEEDFQKSVVAWRRQHEPGQPPARRPFLSMVATARVTPSPTASYIGELVSYNLGAYRQCYLQAHTPGLSGQISLVASYDAATPKLKVHVESATVNDPQLQSCLRDAVAELWLEPYWAKGSFRVEIPFELHPEKPTLPAVDPVQRATPEQVEALATARRDAGDGEGALRHYAALLQHAPAHPRTCYWHLGALQSTLLLEPWWGPRVLAAATALREHTARTATAPLLTDCLAKAAPLLIPLADRLAEEGRSLGRAGLRVQAVERYRWLLSWSPALPDPLALRFKLAKELDLLQRFAEAAAEYAQIERAMPPHSLTPAAAQAREASEERATEPTPTAFATTRQGCVTAFHPPKKQVIETKPR